MLETIRRLESEHRVHDAEPGSRLAATVVAVHSASADIMVFAGVDSDEAERAIQRHDADLDVPTPAPTLRTPFKRPRQLWKANRAIGAGWPAHVPASESEVAPQEVEIARPRDTAPAERGGADPSWHHRHRWTRRANPGRPAGRGAPPRFGLMPQTELMPLRRRGCGAITAARVLGSAGGASSHNASPRPFRRRQRSSAATASGASATPVTDPAIASSG